MEDKMKQRLTSRDIWMRALYMVFFAIAYGVAEVVLTLLVVFQFLATLFTGKANEPLLKLGTNLSTYFYQIIQFQTFNTEEKPFPFSPWPDAEVGENRWLDDPVHEPEVAEESEETTENTFEDSIATEQEPDDSDSKPA
ncbi:MAG: DUF4389 domain-containing protein [Pseudomonadales bacterium]